MVLAGFLHPPVLEPQNFLGPALEHRTHVITHPSRDAGALLAQFLLSVRDQAEGPMAVHSLFREKI